ELALDALEIADAGIGALRVVGHVLEHDQPAATRAKAAQIRIGRIHQRRNGEDSLLVILRPVFGDVELRIACEYILDAAGAIDPGDAVARQRRLGGSGLAEPPGRPAAGRAEGRRVLARHTPARIVVE